MKDMNCHNDSVNEAITLIEKAKQAQRILNMYPQEKIDFIVAGMIAAAEEASERLAKMAVYETGFGNVEDKVVKNRFASTTLYQYIKDLKTVGVLKEDPLTSTVEIATPMGVLAALIPSTNPTSTAIYKTIIAIKSANGIVLSPHPSARNSIIEAVNVVYQAALKAGAPEGIIGCMTLLSLDGTQALMRHPDIAMILATGGEAMVKAAYSSGNPAIGVGPGNCPAFIDKSADTEEAIKKIFKSKTFDNGVICASEQSIVIEKSIEDQVKRAIEINDGYLLSQQESEKISKILLRDNGSMNPEIVGRTAGYIADMAGIQIPGDVRVLVSQQFSVSHQNPYSREKLAPVLALYVEEDAGNAIDRCVELLENEGSGHTASIHAQNAQVIREYAARVPVSRCLINTPSALGAIGATTKLVPALTLGCGAIGGSSVSDNIGPEHLINIKRVAYDAEKLMSL